MFCCFTNVINLCNCGNYYLSSLRINYFPEKIFIFCQWFTSNFDYEYKRFLIFIMCKIITLVPRWISQFFPRTVLPFFPNNSERDVEIIDFLKRSLPFSTLCGTTRYYLKIIHFTNPDNEWTVKKFPPVVILNFSVFEKI